MIETIKKKTHTQYIYTRVHETGSTTCSCTSTVYALGLFFPKSLGCFWFASAACSICLTI